jgi:DNA topoisomerase I
MAKPPKKNSPTTKSSKTGRKAKAPAAPLRSSRKTSSSAKTVATKRATTKSKITKKSAPIVEMTPNGKSLVIVESPAKARTLNGYLGGKYLVQATVGHIWDLPKKRLGVDVERQFEPEYEVIEGKQDVVDALKRNARNARDVFVATDPDREGEAIAFHIAQVIGNSRKNVHRVLFNEITKSAVLLAMGKPGHIDIAKVEAQQARRVLDRLVGYMVSPLLQKIIARGLSAGRVQSVALRLICEREDEIRAFKPVEYWTIAADLLTPKHEKFQAKLARVDGKKAEVGNEKDAKTIVANLEKAKTLTLTDLKTRPKSSSPSAPYTTSTMQQDSARRLGFSNDRTMGIAQALYEGVAIGKDERIGLITYMRTDSTRIAPDASSAAQAYVAEKFGKDYLSDKPRFYASKKAAQDAHEAIRPTDVHRDPQSVKRYLTADQFKLYEMIWRRFVASQMADAKFDVTTAVFATGKYELQASGRRTVFLGHLHVLSELSEERPKNATEELEAELSNELPRLEVGKSYQIEKIIPGQHFTEPPPRFNSASLVKILDELGIGRPSTYAQIISVLTRRKYIENKERRFYPTTLGETVSKLLVAQFPDVFNVTFTARMEEELDDVENEHTDWRKVVQDFYGPFSKNLSKVEQNKQKLKKQSTTITDKKCPECGGAIVMKWGRSGQFLACSNYPECRYTAPLDGEKPPQVPVTMCSNCGKPMQPKKSRFGWFLGCTGYPDCTTTLPLDPADSVPCPKCGDGRVSMRRSKRGRTFWGCSKYPECDFISWYKPVPEPCPNCGNLFMEDKPLKSGHIRQCPKCKHKVEVAAAK